MNIDKSKAVLNNDGDVESFTIKVKGKSFYCVCKANVFHKPDKTNLNLYKCNSCGTCYDSK